MNAIFLSVTAGALLFTVANGAIAADVETLPKQQRSESQAAQQCLQNVQAFDAELSEVGFGVLAPDGYGLAAPYGNYDTFGTPRRRIRALRDAAHVYAQQGDEQNCRATLIAMRAVYDQHQRLEGAEADDPGTIRAWRRVHIKRARPITEMTHLLRADVLLGAEIRNGQDQRLGTIKDVVLNPSDQRITYLLVGRGGFLGIGQQLVAVRWRDLRATEDHELLVLDVSESAFEQAPAVDANNFAATANQDWRQQLDRFWEQQIQG